MDRTRLLKLEVDADSIRYSICTARLPTRPASGTVESDTIITVRAGAGKTSSLYYQIQSLKEHLPGVVIKGLPSVARAVIAIDDSQGAPRYKLFVEGNNLREVIATYGVKGTASSSNNTHEVFTTLGIEAARSTIIHEIQYTMEHVHRPAPRDAAGRSDVLQRRGARHHPLRPRQDEGERAHAGLGEYRGDMEKVRNTEVRCGAVLGRDVDVLMVEM